MSQAIDDEAITQGIEELNEALTRARQANAPLSEPALELLSTVVSGAVAFALIPEAAAGIGVLGAIAGVSAVLAIASSTATGTMLALDLFGAVREEDMKV